MGKAGAPPILFDPTLVTLVVEGLTLHRVSWTLLTSLHQLFTFQDALSLPPPYLPPPK